MIRRHVLAVTRLLAGVALVVLAASGCSVSFDSDTTPAESLAWAGFDDTTGLELVSVEDVDGLDRSVNLVLRGSPSDMDRALEAAQFTNPTTPGIHVYFGYLPGFDPAALLDVRTGSDRWTNVAGQGLFRQFIRGGTPEGKDVIQVAAFTI